MEDLPVFEPLTIVSHKGKYTVAFENDPFRHLNGSDLAGLHFVIDKRVASLYSSELANVVKAPSVLSIEANEANKSLDKFPGYVETLVSNGIRRGHSLVAIGGGVMQDITCFLAATLLRGLPWHFYPTTLLAQADSCIGSKSSINVGKTKNILGTFTPPERVCISTGVLKTLEEREIRSGIGEMLKVHAIEGPESFDVIAADYPRIITDDSVMAHYILRSLEIKKPIVEIDEFDCSSRNIMNYGHTFGHAIESATDFAIPHGIAVSMGMDMANYVAVRLGSTGPSHFNRMHPVLFKNYAGFEGLKIPTEGFFIALSKDKKHTDTKVKIIVPDFDGRLTIGLYPNDDRFKSICVDYLEQGRRE
jgi:3-dehydroquinate synthase